MALCEVHLRSDSALDKMTSVSVILPEGQPGPYPVYYLLHGLSDDHTAWVRFTSLERYVERWPMIVVMPNGERSFYTNAEQNLRAAFETFMVEDLVEWVDRVFQTIPSREGRVIGGLSMGGYGALKLAMKHPDMYSAAFSHSGALAFATDTEWMEDAVWKAEFTPIFGEKPTGGPDDLFAIAGRAAPKTLPAIRFDCGFDDPLVDANRRFHQHLEQLGIPHEYAEFPGRHDWAYWDTHVQEAIAFFAQVLDLESNSVPNELKVESAK